MNNLIDLLTTLQNYLSGDSTLSYIETVAIMDYETDFPAFTTYALILSPKSIQTVIKAIKRTQETSSLDVVCITRNFHQLNSLIGDNDSPGIIQMVYDVFNSIQVFLENNKDTLDVDYTEMEEPIQIKNPKKERAGFYHEVIIPLSCKFKQDKLRR